MIDPSLIGRSLSPVTAHVEPGRLRYFRETLGETNPVYGDAKAAQAAGYAATPVPPTYLFCLEMMDAEQAFEFITVHRRRHRAPAAWRTALHVPGARGGRRHADCSSRASSASPTRRAAR